MFLKKLMKLIFRILKSLYWYFIVSLFSKRFNQTSTFDKIFIICPGPSLRSFSKREFADDSLLIFINHSCKFANEFVGNKILFTSDTIRANEILNYNLNFPRVLALGHIFQMNTKIFRNYNFIIPRISFDFKYGLIGKRCSKISANYLGKNCGIGYGSLLNSISFATRFNPKEINLIGCDFGIKEGHKYGFTFNGVNSETPFNLIYSQFLVIKDCLLKVGIKVIQL
jgi:hypothetical protein